MTAEKDVGKTPSPRICEPASTDSESSAPENPKTSRGRKTFRSISSEHVKIAMTGYLRSMSLIDDDEEVIHYFKTPEGVDVKIGNV